MDLKEITTALDQLDLSKYELIKRRNCRYSFGGTAVKA